MRHNIVDIVNLITTRNNLLKQPLLNKGFTVNEFNPLTAFESLPLSAEPTSPSERGTGVINFAAGVNNYSLVEIPDFNEFNNKNFLEKIKWFYENSKLIIFSETMTHDQKKILLRLGISDCITHFAPERIASYIESINLKPEGRSGKFIILDDNISHRNIISSIIKRFGYETVFTSTIEELFQVIGVGDNIMTLVNIGTTGLDLNGLIRRSYDNSDIKKNPVISYKNMDQGLFIHEIINGLNKLTKVIFSPEELYSMLIDVLFKKEIITYTNPFITALEYEKNSSYFRKNVQQIYYESNLGAFDKDSILGRDNIDSMAASLEIMRKTLARVEGIIWLKL